MRHLSPLDLRIPAWDTNHLIDRPCPVCQGHNVSASFKRPDSLTVNRCMLCDTYFISPAPDVSQLNRFYQRYDIDHRRASLLTPAEAKAAYMSLDPMSDIRIAALASLISLPGKRVLDVGFGRGQFLYLLKRLGCLPTGIELDQDAIEFCKAMGMSDLNLGDWSSVKERDGFDLVSMNDLIEHPLDPRAMLEAAHQWLKPGGLLLIWTPNAEACLEEAEPTTFRVDLEHMQYLSPRSVARISQTLNFDVLHLEALGQPEVAHLIEPGSHRTKLPSVTRLLKRLVGPGTRRLLKRLPGLARPVASQTRGGRYHLFCILRKPLVSTPPI